MNHLTPNFTAEELGVQGAEPRIIQNAAFICEHLLEPIRAHYATSVNVHCGYRPAAHNKAVGGKPDSFHLFDGGKAAVDFHVVDAGIAQCFDWIRGISGLPFDKVILEHDANDVPRCVHIQIDCENPPRRKAFIGGTGDSHQYIPVEVGP